MVIKKKERYIDNIESELNLDSSQEENSNQNYKSIQTQNISENIKGQTQIIVKNSPDESVLDVSKHTNSTKCYEIYKNSYNKLYITNEKIEDNIIQFQEYIDTKNLFHEETNGIFSSKRNIKEKLNNLNEISDKYNKKINELLNYCFNDICKMIETEKKSKYLKQIYINQSELNKNIDIIIEETKKDCSYIRSIIDLYFIDEKSIINSIYNLHSYKQTIDISKIINNFNFVIRRNIQHRLAKLYNLIDTKTNNELMPEMLQSLINSYFLMKKNKDITKDERIIHIDMIHFIRDSISDFTYNENDISRIVETVKVIENLITEEKIYETNPLFAHFIKSIKEQTYTINRKEDISFEDFIKLDQVIENEIIKLFKQFNKTYKQINYIN